MKFDQTTSFPRVRFCLSRTRNILITCFTSLPLLLLGSLFISLALLVGYLFVHWPLVLLLSLSGLFGLSYLYMSMFGACCVAPEPSEIDVDEYDIDPASKSWLPKLLSSNVVSEFYRSHSAPNLYSVFGAPPITPLAGDSAGFGQNSSSIVEVNTS